jgi:polynucleotide 5'-kinase involved in rRNA processing
MTGVTVTSHTTQLEPLTSTTVSFAMSTSSKPQLTAEEIQTTRAKFKQFRILVIGRANAGKTTILRKVCNTTGDPVIFNPDGKKVKYMSKLMSDTDIHPRDLRLSRPILIHP